MSNRKRRLMVARLNISLILVILELSKIKQLLMINRDYGKV
jgi:hypothetical protein